MPEAKAKTPRILVAEDDPGILRVITATLAAEGMQVIPAQDGVAAFQKAVQEQPDAIVLDIGLPMMDGLALCRKLKALDQTAEIPVGFLTAQPGAEPHRAANQAGGMLYLAKPFNPKRLTSFVRLLLAARKVA
jgi:two-component system response regulator MprA